MVPVLAVDIDGVVVHPLERFRDNSWNHFVAEDLGIDPQDLDRLFFRPYWPEIIVGARDLRETLNQLMPQLNPAVSGDQLVEYWFTNDALIDPAVVDELLAWKRRSGGVLVAATNQERHRMTYLIETLGLGGVFDDFIFSGEVGATKSDPAFFARALTRIGADAPESVVFIDDDPGNVATAASAGWTAHLFTGIDSLRQVLGQYPDADRGTARVVFMCGPAGSGKSTFAQRLEGQGMVRLSFDVELWRRKLPGALPPGPVRAEVESELKDRLVRLVSEGRDVVLDFSFWSRAMRDDYRGLLEPFGVVPETIYLATDRETVLQRVRDRRGAHADDAVLSDELAAQYFDHFEVPTEDEGPLRVIHPE